MARTPLLLACLLASSLRVHAEAPAFHLYEGAHREGTDRRAICGALVAPGSPSYPCQGSSFEVDVRTKLWIEPRPSALLPRGDAPLLADGLEERLALQATHLRGYLAAMGKAVEIGAEQAAALARGAPRARLKALDELRQTQEDAGVAAVDGYLQARYELDSNDLLGAGAAAASSGTRADAMQVLRGFRLSQTKVEEGPRLHLDELARTVEERQRAIQRHLGKYRVMLSATVRRHSGDRYLMKLGAPYDDGVGGLPEPVAGSGLDPAEHERLRREADLARAVTETLDQNRAKVSRIGTLVRETAGTLRTRLRAVEGALERSAEVLEVRIEKERDDLAGWIQGNVAQLRAQAGALAGEFGGIVADRRQPLDEVARSLDNLEEDLERRMASPAALDPDTLIDLMTSLVASGRDRLLGPATKDLAALEKRFDDMITRTEASLEAAFRTRPATLRARVRAAGASIVTVAKQELAAIEASVTELEGALKTFAGVLRGAVSLKLVDEVRPPQDYANAVRATSVIPVDFVPWSERIRPGDVLTLRLDALDPDGNPMKDASRQVRIRFFGHETTLSTGLGFIKSKKSGLADFEPSPVISYRRQWHSRRSGKRKLPETLGLGVGVHVTTLDFSPTNSSEFGAGVSLHFANDLLQAGYGWNLGGGSGGREYWYVGVRLFNLLPGR